MIKNSKIKKNNLIKKMIIFQMEIKKKKKQNLMIKIRKHKNRQLVIQYNKKQILLKKNLMKSGVKVLYSLIIIKFWENISYINLDFLEKLVLNILKGKMNLYMAVMVDLQYKYIYIYNKTYYYILIIYKY